ncbi:hypothetical protein FRC02_004934 [Tulasnella sp. 418]|nr:hypothetical protein FRC02_004934 [Tulasnella sp. 418]
MNADFSFPPRPPSSVTSPSTPTRTSFTPIPDSPPSKPSNARPNSHHRRRSSVSTRRESCEMMGVAPDSPVKESHSMGDQRQRALWALEGKQSRSISSTSAPVFGFQKVNIPDWTTPEKEQTSFDWSSSSSSTSSSSSSGSSAHALPTFLGVTSSLAGKRDSFGKNLIITPSASLKAELSTLMEEDEEEETDDAVAFFSSDHPTDAVFAPVASWEGRPLNNRRNSNHEVQLVQINNDVHDAEESSIPILPPSTPKVIPPSPLSTSNNATPTSATKPRPPSLSLRPLSLVSALPSTSSPPLPTPSSSNSISPSPRISGLKFLALSSSSSIPPVASSPHATSSSSSTPASQRQSLVNGLITPSPSPSASSASSPFTATPSPLTAQQRRRSRINYRSSINLDENSPAGSTSSIPNRHSLPVSPSQGQRSVSPESISSSVSSMTDFFQNQAVASLLSRIVSLEEALHGSDRNARPSSLPLTPDTASSSTSPQANTCQPKQSFSTFGASSSSTESSPPNQILEELENLKAERDELNSDITGWRTRCNDLQHSSDLMKRRLAESTNEIWGLKSKCNILTIQATAAQEMAATTSNKIVELQGNLSSLEEKNASLLTENERLTKVNKSLKSQVDQLNGRVESLEKEVNSERATGAAQKLSQESMRLAHLKERNRFEGERVGWDAERREMEQEISRLAQQLAEANKKLAVYATGTATPDLMRTPKAKDNHSSSVPGKGLPFKFPASSSTPPTSPPRNFSPPSMSRFGGRSSLDSNSSTDVDSLFSNAAPLGFGGMNGGFKFGGGASSVSSTSSSGSLHHHAYGSLGVVAEEDEDEEPSHLEKVIEEDEESDVPASSRSSGSPAPSTNVEEDDEEEEDALAGYEDEDSSFEGPEGDEDDDEDMADMMNAAPRKTLTLSAVSPTFANNNDPFIVTPPTPAPEPQSTPRKHAHRRSVSMVHGWKFPKMTPSQSSRRVSQQSITSMNFATRPAKKQIDIDPFFACLEDPANLRDDYEIRLLTRDKSKHKKLPSGCPAFWLDLNEDEDREFSFGLGRSRQHELDQLEKAASPKDMESASETEVEDEDMASSSTEVESLKPVTPLSVTPTPSSPVLSTKPQPEPLIKPRTPSPRPTSVIVPRPTFIPAPGPMSAPIQSRVINVPPSAAPTMSIPPRVNSPPAQPQSSGSSLTSRLTFHTLSSLISWTSKPPKASAAGVEEDSSLVGGKEKDDLKRNSMTSTGSHSPTATRAFRALRLSQL